MKIKTLVIVVAVLAALSAVAYLKNRPEAPPPADPRVGQPVLDADTAQRASSITVADQGKQVTLAKDAGGAWIVTSYYGLPADFEKIARLVQDLNGEKIDRFVTDNPERLSRLGFKDSSVTLADASGRTIWKLDLGKSPDSGSGRFIRYGDEGKAYLSPTSVWLDTDAKGWANSQLISVKNDDVASMEIPIAGSAPVVLRRAKKDDPWTGGPAGRTLIADQAAPLLSTLTSLRFSDTTDAKDAAAAAAHAHDRVFKITTFGGQTYTIAIGRKPEEKRLKTPTKDEAKETLATLAKAGDSKAPPKLVAPEYETIPAGPVYVAISSSDPKAPVNALMAKRSFQLDDYVFTGLPEKLSDLFEEPPPPAPAKAPPTAAKKP